MALLGQRLRRDEIMDQPDLAPAAHRSALRGLARLNVWSGSDGILWPRLRDLAAQLRPAPLRVLDVACGGGDVTVRLARRAARAGFRAEFTGMDRSAVAANIARENADAAGVDVRFVAGDALTGDGLGSFDAVISSLFLHHLDEGDVVALLRRMAAAARNLVLINDLRRSGPGYLLAWAATRALTRSPVVRYDGPASVAGAWTVAEARRLAESAGLAGASVERRWPFRFLLAWEKP